MKDSQGNDVKFSRWLVTPDNTPLGENTGKHKQTFSYAGFFPEEAVRQHHGGMRCCDSFTINEDGRYRSQSGLQAGSVSKIES